MTLSWIAAVLKPEDLASGVPSESSSEEQSTHRLAGLVRGRPWAARNDEFGTGPTEVADPLVTYAEESFDELSIAEGVLGLGRLIVEAGSTGPCRTAAAALLLSCAASELDDYPTVFRGLSRAVEVCDGTATEDAKLARAVLLQQQVLRFLDVGQQRPDLSRTVIDIVASLDAGACTPFRVGAHVVGGYRETIEQILNAVHASAQSLIERNFGDKPPPPRGHGWDREIDRIRGESFAGVSGREFRFVATGSPGRERLTGPVNPFYYGLRLELLGHRHAYRSRVEQAHARLAALGKSDATPSSASTGEILRLLRHGVDRQDLKIAVQWVKANGPLDALVNDARQILQHRSAPEALRLVELHVLQEAAELLTPSERSLALNAVHGLLNGREPAQLPGVWEASEMRLEGAWLALATLADSATEIETVGNALLAAAEQLESSDALLDQALSAAVRQLDWSRARPPLRQAWVDWLFEERDSEPRYTTRSAELSLGVFKSEAGHTLEAVAKKVDAAILGVAAGSDLVASDIDAVTRILDSTREQARKGTHSFGGIPEADVAAALILHRNRGELWGPLLAYLLDPLVDREHKRAAMDRIAGAKIGLPAAIASELRSHADALLHQSANEFMTTPISPFPAALRLLSAHQLIPLDLTIALVTDLLDRSDATARLEAARTLALLATQRDEPAILGMTFHLSYDPDARVRGFAGRAVAATIGGDSLWSAIATDRVGQLLKSEGITAPLGVLSALRTAEQVPDPLRPIVQQLSVEHVSTRIRRAARELLDLTE